MQVRPAQGRAPSGQPPARQGDPRRHTISRRDRYRDQRPDAFGGEAALVDPQAHADGREHHQRQDHRRQHRARRQHHPVAAARIVAVTDNRVEQHEAARRAGEQDRGGRIGRFPQCRSARSQQQHEEHQQRRRQRHGQQCEHQHHHILQCADDLEVFAQHAKRRAKCARRPHPRKPAIFDQVADQLDPEQTEQLIEQEQHQPRKPGKCQRPRPADRIGPDVEMGGPVIGGETQAVEAGLKQRQRQQGEEHTRSKHERAISHAFIQPDHVPRDPAHHQPDQQRKQRGRQ